MIYKNILGYEFKYDEEAEILFRKSKKNNKWKNCNEIKPHPDGYTRIGLVIDNESKLFSLHRIVYMMFNDFDYHDSLMIDHRDNKNPKNNSISNLKAVTRTQNNQNTKRVGVSKRILKRKKGNIYISWVTSYSLDGKRIQKSFKSRDEALFWRESKINQYYYLGK